MFHCNAINPNVMGLMCVDYLGLVCKRNFCDV
jgi:hypothetical protein